MGESSAGKRVGLSAWRNEETRTWWSWAETDEEKQRAPAFLRPLLDGKVRRVTGSVEEIDEALKWAAELPGWEPLPEGRKPLHVYRADQD